MLIYNTDVHNDSRFAKYGQTIQERHAQPSLSDGRYLLRSLWTPYGSECVQVAS